MQITSSTLIINRQNRSAFITFILLCMIAVALGMLDVVVLLQLGAQLSFWLIANGLCLLKCGMALFLAFRLLVVTQRAVRLLQSRCATWPQDHSALWLFALSKEVLVAMTRQLLWLLLR